RDFHAIHHEILGIVDDRSPVEVVSWGARVRIPLPGSGEVLSARAGARTEPTNRHAYVRGMGMTAVPVRSLASFVAGEPVTGPVLVESPFTTIVVADASEVSTTRSGSLVIRPVSAIRAPHPAASQEVHA